MKQDKRIDPIRQRIPAERQSARRHYGVHPYFTRRPHNVVRRYILNYSNEAETILDPFGGSGVTAIEAFLENRRGVQNDISPLANFIASGIASLADGTLAEYREALMQLRSRCQMMLENLIALTDTDLIEQEIAHRLPENVRMPSSADVERYYELFTRKQLLSLASLKDAIDELVPSPAKSGMLLAWSATLAKLNKTFLSAKGRLPSRGGSSIFSIYRYKIARDPVELPPWKTFEERAQNVIDAKREIDSIIELKRRSGGWHGKFEVYGCDVKELEERFVGQIDYIFTDPPYGGHISYLDLSTLWTVWLGLSPSESARRHELIVGGEQNHSEEHYTRRLQESIRSCVNMLKRGRWLSVVFQHWQPRYFEAILEGARESGAELRAAISQVGDPIWSMHKKKGKESVLAGEMILTFEKTGQSNCRNSGAYFSVQDAVRELLSDAGSIVYGEQLFNDVIIMAWRRSAISSLSISKEELTALMTQLGWQYNPRRHYWVRARDNGGFLSRDSHCEEGAAGLASQSEDQPDLFPS